MSLPNEPWWSDVMFLPLGVALVGVLVFGSGCSLEQQRAFAYGVQSSQPAVPLWNQMPRVGPRSRCTTTCSTVAGYTTCEQTCY